MQILVGNSPHDRSFNRTFMELKYINIITDILIKYSFNRTFMELKLGITKRHIKGVKMF